MKRVSPPGPLLLLFLTLALALQAAWTSNGLNQVDGDEPHYLVMASGIARHGVLEQTLPYRQEFETREIFRPGMVPFGTQPSEHNTHAVRGPHGLYNVHNPGLPLLLALPFLFWGVLGAKVFMILCSGLAVPLVWKLTSLYTERVEHRVLAVCATCLALPVLVAANQIFPDLLAGILSLWGLCLFMTAAPKRSRASDLLFVGAMALLPWLQIKFAATALLLTAALCLKVLAAPRDWKRFASLAGGLLASFALLALYNGHAFGKFSGPYHSGALEFSRNSLMVLAGLLFDQNQGFLLQNPILLLGLFGVGALYRRDRLIFLLWLLVFLSLIVPNAMHPAWYGAWSFSGRFGWSAAVVFFLPTILGLVRLGQAHPRALRLAVGLSALVQAYFYSQYLTGAIWLYNRAPFAPLDGYSAFHYPLHRWVPALYNAAWAYGHPPNAAWLGFVLVLLGLGFAPPGRSGRLLPRWGAALLGLGLLVIAAAGFAPCPANDELAFAGQELTAQAGRTDGQGTFASQGRDAPGLLTSGPLIPLRRGAYEARVRYSGGASASVQVGRCEVWNASMDMLLASAPLFGTGGQEREQPVPFVAHQWFAHRFEVRNHWDGVADMRVLGLRLLRR